MEANSVVAQFEPKCGDESEEVLVKYGNLVANPRNRATQKVMIYLLV